MLIAKKLVPQGTHPGELFTFCKLFQKDKGRPRYHLLVRDPSREEMSRATRQTSVLGFTFPEDIAPFIITETHVRTQNLWGKILLGPLHAGS